MDHIRYANGEIPQDGWGGFEAYMKKKASKLASQFQLDAGKCDKNGTSSIFKGVSIYVNGYTDPPAEKLKRLMMMHGGRFIYYPTKANTTHIIASNLAYTKIKELKNEKVVRPTWITDSLKAGKLLPHAPYILYRPKASNQTLHRFADKKPSRLDRVQHATESKGEASSLITNPESVSRNVTTEGYYPSSDHKREKVSKPPTEEETDIAPTDSKPDRCDDVTDDVTDTVRKGDTFPAPVIHEGDISSEKFATHELKRVDRSSSEKLGEKGMTRNSKQKMSANRDEFNCIKTTREIESDRSSKKRVSQEGTKTLESRTSPVDATASPSSLNEKSPKLKTEECPIDDNSEDITDPPQFGKLYFPKSTDPNFLPSFYRHSSFYHLTTWRAEHRLFVKELHRKSDGTFPSKEKLIARYGKNRVNSDQKKLRDNKPEKLDSDGATPEASGEWRVEDDDDDRVMMHIDMDAFFVKVSLLNYPELAGKPVAVAHYAGKPVNKSLKNWNEKSLSQKYSNQKTHCMEFWAGKDKPEILRNAVKGDGEIGDEEDRSDGLPKVDKTEPSPQTLVASESENFSSLAAIASCSYEARLAGVRNGMIMKTAKELCPELRTIPYNFEGYYRVSRQLYEIVAGYTHDIQAASCDEVILDVTNLMEETGASGAEIAESMREEIYKKTQCTASAGLAPNVILAKLCTKRAKPDGVYTLRREDIPEFLKQAPVGDLPGIGRAFNQKLQSLGIYTCVDLQNVSLKTLQKHFGPKIGQVLSENCRGQDTRPMRSERERKYVSVEVNYGIRFDNDDDAYQFVHRLSEEVHRKLKRLTMVGRTITLKLKVRRAGTPIEDPKFMGYGIYDNKIRSTSLTMETDNSETIYRACRGLLIQMAVSAKDLRGVGIQMSRLKPPSSMTNKTKSLTEMLPKKGDSPTQPKCPISPKLSPPKTKEKPNTLLSFVTKKRVCVSPNSATKMSKAQNVMKKIFAPLNGLPLDGKRLAMRHNKILVAESKGRFPNSSREGLFKKGELSSTDQTNVQRFGSNVGVDKKLIDSHKGMKTEEYDKSQVPVEINQGRKKESSIVPKTPKGPVSGVKRALTFDKVETMGSTKRGPSNTNTSSMGDSNNAAMNNINKGRLDVTDRAKMEQCKRVARDNTSRASSANRAVMDGANNGSSDHTRRLAVQNNNKPGLQYASRAAGDHSNKAGRDPSNRAVTDGANNGSSDHTRRVAVKDNDKPGLQYASRAAGDHSNKAGRDPSNRAVTDGANNGSSDHTRRVAVKDNDKPGLQYASRAAGDHSNKAGRDPSNRAVMNGANNGSSDHTRRVAVQNNKKPGLQYASRAAGDHSNKAGRDPSNRAVTVVANNGSSDHTRRVAIKDNDKPGLQNASRAAGDHSNKAGRVPSNGAVTVVANNGSSDHTRRVAVQNNNKPGLQYASRAAGDHSNKAGRHPSNRAVMDGANNGSSVHTRRVAVQNNDKTGLQYASRAAGDHSNKAGRHPSNRAVMDGANNGSSDHTRRVAVQNNDKTGLQYASRAAGDHSNKAGRDPSNRAVMDGANNGSSDHTRRVAVQNNDKTGLQYTSRAAGDHSNKAGRDPSNRAVTVVAHNGLSDHTRRVPVKDNDKTGLQYASRAAGDHSNKAGRDPSNRASIVNVNRATKDMSNRAAVNNVDRGVMVHRNIGRNNCIDKADAKQKDRTAMRPSIHATAMDNTNKAFRNKISRGKVESSKKGLPLEKDKTKSPKRKTVNLTATSDTIGGVLGKTSSRTPRAMTDKRARYQTIAETTRSKLAVFKREENKQEKTSAKISTGKNVSVTSGIHGQKELGLPTINKDDTGSGGGGKLRMNKVVGEKQGAKRTRESNTSDGVGYDVVGTTDCSAAVNGKVVSRKNFTTPRGALTSRNGKINKYPKGKIDPSVLDSIPTEIQSEVLRESKLGLKNSSEISDNDRKTKHFDPNQASTSTGITSKLDQEVLQNLPADILQEVVESERCRLKLEQSTPIGGTNQTLGARTAGKRNIPEAFNMKEFAFKKKKCDRKLKIGERIATDPSTDSISKTNDGKSRHELSTNDDMNIHNFIKEDQHSDEYAETELDPSVIEDRETVKSEVVAAEAKKKKKKISLGGAFTIEDVKNMMKQWMEFFSSPLDEDISHVVHFMRSHILDQNLEMVFQLLRAFKRMVSTGDSQDWRNAYITVKERIQTTVGHIYGSSLKLDEDL